VSILEALPVVEFIDYVDFGAWVVLNSGRNIKIEEEKKYRIKTKI